MMDSEIAQRRNGMDNTRPILYGVGDYARSRRGNAWFVDRTVKIRDLEANGGNCVLSEEAM